MLKHECDRVREETKFLSVINQAPSHREPKLMKVGTLALLLLMIGASNLISQTTSTPTKSIIITNLNDPKLVVAEKLKSLGKDPKVTVKSRGNYVYFTMHCQDLAERDAIYNGFLQTTKVAMSGTKEPPTVCVIFVEDAAEYRDYNAQVELERLLNLNTMHISGKVFQVFKDGEYLISLNNEDRQVIVTDARRGMVDKDRFSDVCFYLYNTEYTTVNNAKATVWKYTASVGVARDYYRQRAEDLADTELRKRTTDKPNLP
jgi:hypothetical protein